MPALPNFLKKIPTLALDETKKKILLFYGVGLLVVFIAYFYFFLKPSLARSFRLIRQARGLRTAIRATRDDLAFEGKLKTKFRLLKEKLGGYEKKLSREKELPMLLENLSGMAKASRIKILGITPLAQRRKSVKGEGSEEEVYQEVPFRITAQSGYHEIGAFLNKLENDPRYMQVTDLKIKSGGGNSKRHSIEFVVYAYTFKSAE